MANFKLFFGKTTLIAMVLLLSAIVYVRLQCQEPPNHQGHFGAVHCAAFSPDGTKIVTAGYDNTARIWDVESGKELHVLKGHRGHSAGINSVAFSPDGMKIITAGAWDYPLDADGKGNIRIWDAETGKELLKLEGYKGGWCHSAAFSPDGKKAVAGSMEDTIFIWEVDSGKILQKFEGHELVSSVTFSSDGKKIITVDGNVSSILGDGKIVRIWDTESGKELHWFEEKSWDKIFSAAFFPDGKKILTINGKSIYDGINRNFSSGIARICDAESGKELQKFEVKHELCISAVISPDGKQIATVGARDNTARIWDVESGKELQKFEHKPGTNSTSRSIGVNSVAFSSDGKRIVTAEDDTVRIWDAESGKELKKWTWKIGYWLN